jgi:hypothetical protein
VVTGVASVVVAAFVVAFGALVVAAAFVALAALVVVTVAFVVAAAGTGNGVRASRTVLATPDCRHACEEASQR